MGSGGVKLVGEKGNVKMFPIAQGKNTVADVEKSWRDGTNGFGNPNVEYAVVYDPNSGEIPVVYQGDAHHVNVRAEEGEKEGYTLTHFHPDKNFGGTLSTTDIRTLTSTKLGEIRAVTRQGITYGLRAGSNANRAGMNAWAKRSNNILQKNFNNSYASALQRAREGRTVRHVSPSGKVTWRYNRDAQGNVIKMTPAQAAKYARTYSVGMYDRAIRKAAEQYGFTYYKKKN